MNGNFKNHVRKLIKLMKYLDFRAKNEIGLAFFIGKNGMWRVRSSSD